MFSNGTKKQQHKRNQQNDWLDFPPPPSKASISRFMWFTYLGLERKGNQKTMGNQTLVVEEYVVLMFVFFFGVKLNIYIYMWNHCIWTILDLPISGTLRVLLASRLEGAGYWLFFVGWICMDDPPILNWTWNIHGNHQIIRVKWMHGNGVTTISPVNKNRIMQLSLPTI